VTEAEQTLVKSNSGASAAPAPVVAGKRVLLIEDEPRTRLVLLQKLRTAGFDVDFASNGHLALEKLKKNRPDAIFMDLLLPFLKGAEVIKKARKESGFGNRPIYVCTSAALMEAWTRRGIKAGATKVFNKATTQVDDIIAEVVRDLSGSGKNPEAADRSTPAGKSDTEQIVGVPRQIQRIEIPLDEAPRSVLPATNGSPAAPKPSSAKTSTFVKRALSALHLGKAVEARRVSAKPAPPAETPKVTPAPSSPVEVNNPQAEPEPVTPSQETKPVVAAGQITVALNGSNGAAANQKNGAVPDTSIWFHIDSQTKPGIPLAQHRAPAAEVPSLPPAESGSGEGARAQAPAMSPDMGILQIDKEQKIVYASDLCAAMFGWESLAGQPIGVLLKDGLQNDLGQFLEQTNPADRARERSSFRIVARKKDGAEFPASVVLTRKAGDPRYCWTAVFGIVVSANEPVSPILTPAIQEFHLAPSEKSLDELLELQRAKAALEGANNEAQKQLEALASDAEKLRETLERTQTENEQLAAGILINESELERSRGTLHEERQSRKQLEETLSNLATAKAELEAQLEGQSRITEELSASSGQLQQQLEAAKAAAERAEAACHQEIARATRLEEEFANLQKAYDELNLRLAAEQKAAVEAERRGEELEQKLGVNSAELERVGAELVRQSAERERLDSEWRGKLDEAGALTKKMETAWLEEAARNKGFEDRLRLLSKSLRFEQIERTKRFEQQLTGLGQTREELSGKLSSEQQTVAESNRRAEELESRLREKSAEVDLLHEKLATQTAEQAGLESGFRNQLETAEELTSKLETALAEAQERSKQFEQELAGLRQTRDELIGRLTSEQQAVAESRRRAEELEARLRENTAELERVKAELEQAGRQGNSDERLANLQHVGEGLRGELKIEQEASVQSRLRSEQLEKRLRENSAELDRVKTDRIRAAEQQASLESDLRCQLASAKMAVEQSQAALDEKAAECSHFESELVAVRRARAEVAGKLAEVQRAAAESRRKSEELETRLQETTSELERFRTETGRHTAEQSRLESELREQLLAAQSAAERAEAALEQEASRNLGFDERLKKYRDSLQQEESNRNRRLEEELVALRCERDELQVNFGAEKQAGSESKRREEGAQNRLREITGEFERLKTEFQTQAKQQRAAETALCAERDAALAAATRAESARVAEAGRVTQLDEESAGLRRASDELRRLLATEQHSASESRRRSEELENQLRQTGAELDRAKVEFQQQLQERGQAESELRSQLAVARSTIEQVESAHAAETARRTHLEEELSGLRRTADELGGRLAAEQSGTHESRQRSDGLENQLRQTTAELERIKAELQQKASERDTRESEFTRQLQAARDAVAKAEAAQNAELTRRNQLEEELVRLRGHSDELNGRLAAEQIAASDSKRRSEELENQLRQTGVELDRLRSELQQQANERGGTESDLRNQLHSARTSAELELARLRALSDELNGKLAAERAAVSDSKRGGEELENQLRQTTSELDWVKSELRQQTEQRGGAESELRIQLDAARAAVAQAEDSRDEEAEQRTRLEEELASLRRAADELRNKLSAEQGAVSDSRQRSEDLESQLRQTVAELEQIKAELQIQSQERGGTEAELRAQLDAARSAAVQAESVYRQEEASRRTRFDEELAGLRRIADELNLKLETEQNATAESARRSEELQGRLRETTSELERVKAELQTQAGAHGTETELREQLSAATAAAEEAKKAFKEKLAESKRMARRFETELENLRQERLDICDKFKAEQQAGTKSKLRIKELEQTLQKATASFAVARVELSAELQAARSAADGVDSGHQELLERCNSLERELAELQTVRDDLSAQLKAEQEAAIESRKRVGQLDGRLRESAAELEAAHAALENDAVDRVERDTMGAGLRVLDVGALARLTAELEKERVERRRAEHRAVSLSTELENLHHEIAQLLEADRITHSRVSELEDQLAQREQALVRATTDLHHESNERRLAEEQLQAVGDLGAQLRQSLSLFEESKLVFKSTQDDLQSRLQVSLNSLNEAESKLQTEQQERHQLQEALSAAECDFNNQLQRTGAELSRLQSNLLVEQFERKRLEGEAVHARYATLDSARVGAAMVRRLRDQLWEPVQDLVKSVRNLLALEPEGQQGTLLQSVLENALLLKTNLEAPGLPGSNSRESKPSGETKPGQGLDKAA